MSQNIKSIFTDAYILLILFSLLLSGTGFIKGILYPEEIKSGIIFIRAYNIDTRHMGKLRVGDTLYDSITKRCVGEITELYSEYNGGGADIFMKLDAERAPRGPLRCHKLWFEWERIDATDFKHR